MLTGPWDDVTDVGRDGRAANMTLYILHIHLRKPVLIPVEGRLRHSRYLISLYWSVLTLTTIGNTASPRSETEYRLQLPFSHP